MLPWLILLCFLVLFGLAVAVYMMPSESQAQKASKKREKVKDKESTPAKASLMPDPIAPQKPTKDWQSIAERWEKQNDALKGEIEKMKMAEKKTLADIEQQRQELKDLMEKLAQEKSWREKEQVNLNKAKAHEKDLKDQIIRTEKDLEKEHSSRLSLERELQDIKVKHETASGEKLTAMTKAASLETTLKALTKEVQELKSANADLKRKREDVQWVAASEHEELKQKLNQVQHELTALKNKGSGAS